MPIDPYAALHALLRAEAVRNSPSTHPSRSSGPSPEAAAPAQVEEEDQGAEKKTGQHDR
ncbi:MULTISPECIES: hypothetical protein [unclassified Streptomyces]|uniref:hypothetical protein n=1 Tax=unclassified Streptomyces TaxID=2593676 RepID=UPI00340F4A98